MIHRVRHSTILGHSTWNRGGVDDYLTTLQKACEIKRALSVAHPAMPIAHGHTRASYPQLIFHSNQFTPQKQQQQQTNKQATSTPSTKRYIYDNNRSAALQI